MGDGEANLLLEQVVVRGYLTLALTLALALALPLALTLTLTLALTLALTLTLTLTLTLALTLTLTLTTTEERGYEGLPISRYISLCLAISRYISRAGGARLRAERGGHQPRERLRPRHARPAHHGVVVRPPEPQPQFEPGPGPEP